jgi:lysozyme family protein
MGVEANQRQSLFNTMIIRDNIVSNGVIVLSDVDKQADSIVNRILIRQQRYESIAHIFPNPGLKWWLIATIHYMECNLNFSCYLGNGQPLNIRTTMVPKGRGPFRSFEEGAIDAITLQGLDKITDWSIGNVLYILEGYNGYGYSLYHGINSPYLWSGTNQYTSGKYIFDGTYNPNAVSGQIGAAIILKKLLDTDSQ